MGERRGTACQLHSQTYIKIYRNSTRLEASVTHKNQGLQDLHALVLHLKETWFHLEGCLSSVIK